MELESEVELELALDVELESELESELELELVLELVLELELELTALSVSCCSTLFTVVSVFVMVTSTGSLFILYPSGGTISSK